MPLLDDLRDGRHGVTLTVPASWERERDDGEMAKLVDAETGLNWHFFFFPNLHLDLSAASSESLQRDVKLHAQFLLELMNRTQADDEGAPQSPRHPLVSCTQTMVGDAPALSVIHRMMQRPGNEVVMAHLLIPVETGTFEARWLGRAQMTGQRESILLMKELEKRGELSDVETDELMRSIDYDAVEHDATFPDHVLSIVRRADKWLCEDSGLRVTSTAKPLSREVTLAELGCTITVPPRFVLENVSSNIARFNRLSLAGNDGVQQFFLHHDEAFGDVSGMLEGHVRNLLVAFKTKPGEVKARAGTAPLTKIVIADGERGPERVRVSAGAFRPGGSSREVCILTMTTTSGQPADVIEEELVAAASTYQRKAGKPWWKFWA